MLCFPKDHKTGTIFSKQFPGVDPKGLYAKRAGVHSHQENCSPSLFLLKFEVAHLKKCLIFLCLLRFLGRSMGMFRYLVLVHVCSLSFLKLECKVAVGLQVLLYT